MIVTAGAGELSQEQQSELAHQHHTANIGTSAISSDLGLRSEDHVGVNSQFYTNQAQSKTAAVFNINAEVQLPENISKKKNKNDFYRFLLQTNSDQPDNVKINNDVFIPRSILKKSNVPGSIKEQRLEAAAEEFFEYQLAVHQMKRDNSEEYLGKYEVVFGQHLDSTNPLLSPKFKQLVQDGLDIDEFMQMQLDDTARTRAGVTEPGTNVLQDLSSAHLHENNSSTTMVKESPTKATLSPLDQGHILESKSGEVTTFKKQEINKTPSEIMPPPNPLPVKSYDISYANLNSQQQSEQTNPSNTRKIKIRQAIKDKGVFETGVDVIEHELELDEDDEGRVRAMRLYNDGKLTHKQMKEILMRQLKQERIFGFGSFNEFFTDYFKKDLVAVEDLNRVRVLKEARKRYERRWDRQGQGHTQG